MEKTRKGWSIDDTADIVQLIKWGYSNQEIVKKRPILLNLMLYSDKGVYCRAVQVRSVLSYQNSSEYKTPVPQNTMVLIEAAIDHALARPISGSLLPFVQHKPVIWSRGVVPTIRPTGQPIVPQQLPDLSGNATPVSEAPHEAKIMQLVHHQLNSTTRQPTAEEALMLAQKYEVREVVFEEGTVSFIFD